MTRVAVLCDIHGNLPALRAVLDDVAREEVETIVIGGDAVAGPLPVETIERLMALGDRAVFVRGNADREIVEAYDSSEPEAAEGPAERTAAFAAARISPGQRDFLDRFEAAVAVDVDGLGEVLFCHGSPRSDTEIITTATTAARLRGILAGVEQEVVVGGRTASSTAASMVGGSSTRAASASHTRGAPAPTGRCSDRMWNCAGPNTTLTRQSRSCEPPAFPT